MTASMDSLEGVSVCALVLSVFASFCCGWLVMRFRILEERLQRTLDENGVVRKKFLPGEVFAVPAMAGEASDARLKEIEAKLSAAMGDLKAAKQEVRDLEDKLTQMDRRLTTNTDQVKFQEKKFEGMKPHTENAAHHTTKFSSFANGTSSTAVAEFLSGPKLPELSEKAQLNGQDVRTGAAIVDNTSAPEKPQGDPSQFSIMADIGFTKAYNAAQQSFEPGAYKKPPSLYGPPQTPARATSTSKSPAPSSQAPASISSSQTALPISLLQAPVSASPKATSAIPSLQASTLIQSQTSSSDREPSIKAFDDEHVQAARPMQSLGPLPPPAQPSKIIDALLNGTPTKAPLPESSLYMGNSVQLASSLQFDDDARGARDMTPFRPISLAGLQASSQKNRPESPVGSVAASVTASSRKNKPFVQHAPPLSARGIHPDKHPELHAKELTEMRRLLDLHCGDSADVVSRTSIRCLWCKETIMCPPYRPQSFFFKDVSNAGEHDGHFWICTSNPNVTLQAGKGVNVGDGKVLI